MPLTFAGADDSDMRQALKRAEIADKDFKT